MSIVSRALFPFILFVLYDLNSVLWGICIFQKLFFIGLALVGFNTVVLIGEAGFFGVGTILFWIPAAFCLLLLIYALFFALPFIETYLVGSENPTVCNQGLYAMSRHPGVLFFFGFYLFLFFAYPTQDMAIFAIVSNISNVLYAVLQDRWTFPRSLAGYDAYREEVPFLIPNRDSFQNGLKTFKK